MSKLSDKVNEFRPFKLHFWGMRPFKRHSLVLLVAGLFYIANGLVYIFAKSTQARKQALIIALQWCPIQFWGGVFIVVGVLAFLSARWPPISGTWGYMVLAAFSAGWSATYATGVIFAHSPATNFSGALTWGLFAFVWWAISGLVNPDKTVVVVITDDGPS